MFRSIRWRLVAWTMLILVVILGTLGTAVYVALERSLLQQVDRNLASRSEQAAPIFGNRDRRGGPGDRDGYRGGVFYLGIEPDGTIFANPQQVNLEGASIPLSAPGAGGSPPRDTYAAIPRDTYATVTIDGERARILVRSIPPPAPQGSRIVVGESLAAVEVALRSLILILVVGGVAGVLFSLAGAWFLAGRALVPIERAFRRQQEFVADASHELRTPLTVLQSATDLLNKHRAEPLQSNGELFDDIRLEIGRLGRLAGDLLTLARSDRGELELAVAPIDLGLLAGEVVRRVEPLAAERGILLQTSSIDHHVIVEADPDRLQQVVLVLLDNAIKHTPEGGEVRIVVTQVASDGVLEIVDTGPGIPREQLPRVFDRFYRADSVRNRNDGGTGLGLAIAKSLIDAHGGQLTLANAPGAGTAATVRLPRVDESSAPIS